ncbi:hypothetical protein [Streptomyces sp. NRRL F-5123]|uniref:hypothetical protein n=1 Tax=Streptomyces sp. NRRL F-5123 TaxID=1463856 RepID=UPI0004E0E0B4|nr:hypothetical protein [Streptomyces sp. NRRL F-5123]
MTGGSGQAPPDGDGAAERRARSWLCVHYAELRADAEEDGFLDDFQDAVDGVRGGGSALAALRALGHDPALGSAARGAEPVGSSFLWSAPDVQSAFRCPRRTGRCSASVRRDPSGAWPECRLDPDFPDGVPMKPVREAGR